MNIRAVTALLGGMQAVLALAMVLCGVFGVLIGETDAGLGLLAPGVVGGLFALVTLLLWRPVEVRDGTQRNVFRREGLAAVGLGWCVSCVFGAIPFMTAGFLDHPIDALFETASGFTTTGATILSAEQFEAMPSCLALWRATTHWLGGVGIVVILVTVLPVGGRSLFRSEVPGVDREAFLRRAQDSAKAALKVYVGLTMAEIALLKAMGVGLFDAVVHSFATIATGGFSSHPESVAWFGSFKVELVLVGFMFLAGTNFAFYHIMLRKGFREGLGALFKDPEWRFYTSIIVSFTLLIGVLLWFQAAPIAGRDYSHLGLALRDALFQVVSVGTSTGFATADFNQWPELARLMLLGLIMTGACAGSTSGGIKLIRVRLMFHLAAASVRKFSRPRAINVVRMGDSVVTRDMSEGVVGFLLTWSTVLVVGVFLLVASGMTILEALASSATCLGNIGPGLGRYGPAASFGPLAGVGKLIMVVLMVLGRLEFYALLALMRPRFWRA